MSVMPHPKPLNPEEQKLKHLEQEYRLAGTVYDLLKLGSFKGNVAQQVLMSQMYMKNIADSLKAEIDKIAPMKLPEAPVEASVPVSEVSK